MNDTPERWAPVVGYEKLYEVSDLGSVRSWHAYQGNPGPRLLRQNWNIRGYLCVGLCDAGKRETRAVHAIVLDAFVGKCPEGEERRHLDDDPLNNRLPNLSYGTHSQNMLDQVRNGTHFAAEKTHCKSGHPFDVGNTYITPVGKRHCRACQCAASIRYRLQRKSQREAA